MEKINRYKELIITMGAIGLVGVSLLAMYYTPTAIPEGVNQSLIELHIHLQASFPKFLTKSHLGPLYLAEFMLGIIPATYLLLKFAKKVSLS